MKSYSLREIKVERSEDPDRSVGKPGKKGSGFASRSFSEDWVQGVKCFFRIRPARPAIPARQKLQPVTSKKEPVKLFITLI